MRRVRAEVEGEKDEILAQGRESKRQALARESLGERIKRLRTAAGLSQQAVADAAAQTPDARDLDLSAGALQASLSRIESGVTKDPGAITLRALASGMGLAVVEVLDPQTARQSP